MKSITNEIHIKSHDYPKIDGQSTMMTNPKMTTSMHYYIYFKVKVEIQDKIESEIIPFFAEQKNI